MKPLPNLWPSDPDITKKTKQDNQGALLASAPMYPLQILSFPQYNSSNETHPMNEAAFILKPSCVSLRNAAISTDIHNSELKVMEV